MSIKNNNRLTAPIVKQVDGYCSYANKNGVTNTGENQTAVVILNSMKTIDMEE